jgi:hypothetical protein
MTRYPEDDPALPPRSRAGSWPAFAGLGHRVERLSADERQPHEQQAFASLWFLAVLPAYLCALICYVGDPAGARSSNFYLNVRRFVGLVIIGSAAFLGKASSAWSCCPRSG